MAMVMKVMARMGCTSTMVRKNSNGHQSYGKGGMFNKMVSKNGNGHDTDSKDGMHQQCGQ